MPKIEKNKITFIIPSINRTTLTNSVNSLLNQTDKNWKCIIIYDGVDGIKFKDNGILASIQHGLRSTYSWEIEGCCRT